MSSRAVGLTILLLTVAAAFACVLELPLIWDGSSQLAVTLIEQRPFVYLTRFHTWFLWWPTVWLSRVTEEQSVLLLAYGLPFLLAPAVSVAASWWFVRRHAPALVIWSAFGIAASLPGQAFVINDSIWQQTLAWPLILGALVPLTWPQRLAWLAFGACQFPHHVGVVVLGMAFVASLTARQCWARLALLVLLCLAAAKAIWVSVPVWSGPFFDSYAAQEASRDRMWQTLRTSVVGWTLAGLVPLWVAGAVLVLKPDSRRWPVFLLGMTALAWAVYAVIPGEWISAINYRRWVVPISVPFMLTAILDACWSARRQPERGPREAAMVMIATIFAIVIGAQSMTFHRLLENLRSETAALKHAVVARAELQSPNGTVLDHWSLTATFMFIQGRVPAQYLAGREADRAALLAVPARVHLHPGAAYPAEPGHAGWFDHRPLLSRMPTPLAETGSVP